MGGRPRSGRRYDGLISYFSFISYLCQVITVAVASYLQKARAFMARSARAETNQTTWTGRQPTSPEAVIVTAVQPRPTTRCFRCRSTKWRQKLCGNWVCAVCRPGPEQL